MIGARPSPTPDAVILLFRRRRAEAPPAELTHATDHTAAIKELARQATGMGKAAAELVGMLDDVNAVAQRQSQAFEQLAALFLGMVFCAAVDRNGYLPTHNARYSKPQSSDPLWSATNCRNRRIFDDRTGIAAARSYAQVSVADLPVIWAAAAMSWSRVSRC